MSLHWKNALIPFDTSVESAIRNLDETALQVALVVDKENHLLGTVTDGDIRRGILKGIDLTRSILDIMNTNSFVVSPNISKETVLNLMKEKKIHQIPIVNDKKIVVGLHLLDVMLSSEKFENIFVIMAGGKGLRLRPLTEKCPKPLLHVAGKPILEHIILKARDEGFYKFRIAIHYLGHMIEKYFGDGSKLGVEIEYLREEQPLGTAGALSLLPYKDRYSSVIITNGDLISNISYSDLIGFHNNQDSDATMAVRIHEWQNPFGVVSMDGLKLTGFEEKPIQRTFVNAGIYVVKSEYLQNLSEVKQTDMPSLFLQLIEKSRNVIVFPIHENWLDIGRPEDLSLATKLERII